MRREFQVHFANSGQLAWHEDQQNVEVRLKELMKQKTCFVSEKETGRHFAFDTQSVIAIIVTNKVAENDTDLWRRTYAAKEGNVQEDDKQKHWRDGPVGLPQETSDRCCF